MSEIFNLIENVNMARASAGTAETAANQTIKSRLDHLYQNEGGVIPNQGAVDFLIAALYGKQVYEAYAHVKGFWTRFMNEDLAVGDGEADGLEPSPLVVYEHKTTRHGTYPEHRLAVSAIDVNRLILLPNTYRRQPNGVPDRYGVALNTARPVVTYSSSFNEGILPPEAGSRVGDRTGPSRLRIRPWKSDVESSVELEPITMVERGMREVTIQTRAIIIGNEAIAGFFAEMAADLDAQLFVGYRRACNEAGVMAVEPQDDQQAGALQAFNQKLSEAVARSTEAARERVDEVREELQLAERELANLRSGPIPSV
jgi:hypothetical protein